MNNPAAPAYPLRWVGLAGLALLCVYLSWMVIAPFAKVLLLAIVLAVVFYPLHDRINRRIRYPSVAAVVSCFAVVLIIIIPVLLTIAAVIPELYTMGDKAHGSFQNILSDPEKQERVHRLTRNLTSRFHIDLAAVLSHLQGVIGDISHVVIQRSMQFVKGTIGFLMGIIFVLFSLFFLFRDGPLFADKFADVLPMEKNNALRLLMRARDMIFASVYGVLVIATIQGVLGGVMFAILGIPSAILWGVMMILASIIPLAGAFIIWVPAAFYLALTGAWAKMIVLVLWGALVVGSVDNFLRPKLVSGRTKTHEIVVFFSVLGGLHVFGMLGFLLGPTIVSVTWALIDVIRQDQTPLR